MKDERVVILVAEPIIGNGMEEDEEHKGRGWRLTKLGVIG